MANGEDENLNPAEQEQKKSRGRAGGNPLKGIENKANSVKHGAETGQKLFNQQAQKQTAKQTATNTAKIAEKAAKNVKRAEKMGKVASQASKVATTSAKLGKIIAAGGWIVLLILAIIGLLVFIITGLGLIMSGLEHIVDGFRTKIAGFLYGTEKVIEDDSILDTLTYLEEMDYDLYGYGFSTVQDPLTEVTDDSGNPTGEKKLTYPSDEWHWTFFSAMDAAQKHSNAYKYIRAYLISDNYAYTLRHQNRTLANYFSTFFSGHAILGEGLLGIYHEDGIGKIDVDKPYVKSELGSITVDGTKLKIVEAGVFKRTIMEYDLDGWAGRYGMPLEFLLSIHLATMAPDLSYKMATTDKFKTEVQIALHKIESGQVNSAVGQKGDSKQVTFGEMEEICNTFFGDDWRLNPKEAKELFDAHDGILESYTKNDISEYECMGPPDWSEIKKEELWGNGNNVVITKDNIKNAIKEIENSNDNVIIDYNTEINNMVDDIYSTFILNNNSQASIGNTKTNMNIRVAAITKSFKATVEKEMVVNFKSKANNKLTFNIDSIGDIIVSIHDKDEIYLDGDISAENCKRIANLLIDEINAKVQTANIEKDNIDFVNSVTMILNNDFPIAGASEYQVTFPYTVEEDEPENNNNQNNNGNSTQDNVNSVEIDGGTKEYYLDGKVDGKECSIKFVVQKTFYDVEKVQSCLTIIGSYSQPLEERATFCSEKDNHATETCSHCVRYLKDIYKALKATNNSDLDTYLPYIYRVKDHWFRDVYFSKHAIEDNKIVQNDDEYEKKTGERWTLYETDSEENYVLYAYFKNGNDYDPTLSDVTCNKVEKGEGKYKLSEDGITYVKAETGKGEYNLSDDRDVEEFRVGKKAVENTNITEDYNAYKLNESGDQTWKNVEIDNDSDEYLKKIDQSGLNIRYQASYGTVEQVEDGVRGETNPEIKKLFLDEYYLYDGTTKTAALIQKAKEQSNSDDPDAFEDKNTEITAEVTKQGEKIKHGSGSNFTTESETYTEKYKATIDSISGPISLTHSSLNAFSILENIHTLDSEFIYHDFKELIVELNYFDKEDLVEAEDQVMMFPVSGITSAGWPITRYDKSEDFYGTLIHSAEDLRTLKKETEVDMQEIIDAENGPPEPEPIGDPVNPVQSEPVTPANGGGDTSYANASELTDKQKMILQAAEDVHYYLETNGYDYEVEDASKLKGTLEESISSNSKYVCCATFIGWTAQALGMQFSMSHGSLTVNQNIANEVQGVQEISVSGVDDFRNKLEPGDVVWRPRDGGQGHTQIFVGFDESGKFLWYNCGSSDSVKKAQPYESSYEIGRYQKIFRWTECEISYNGMTSNSSSTAEFTGFEGGETVVAPVTGELIAYGTTKRKNIEVKAAKKKDEEVKEEEDKVVKLVDPIEEPEEMEDEVGFIKIRVLGNEEAAQTKDECTAFAGNKKTFRGNEKEAKEAKALDWLKENYGEDSEELKHLGYDYFWEEYNDAGIGDYVLYIEGFEIPEEIGASGKNSEANRKALASFIKQLQDPEIELDTELSNGYSTQYTVPNLLDDKREFELKVAEAAKEMADYVYEKEGRIYIKEGAAIGRTYDADSTDIAIKEVEIKEPEPQEPDDPATPEPTPDPTPDPNNPDEPQEPEGPYTVGNYLRVIFRDTDDEVAENVEEYIEVGEGGQTSTGEIEWELLYFLPYESGGIGPSDSGKPVGPEIVDTKSSTKCDVGIIQWTTNESRGTNGVPAFCKMAAEQNPTLCGSLAKYGTMSISQILQPSVRNELQNAFTEICNKDRDGFLQVQIEIAKNGDGVTFDGGARSGYLRPIVSKNPWLADAPLVVQGTVMSAQVYRGAENYFSLTQGDDKGNIEAALQRLSNYPDRVRGQGEAANDILDKKVTQEEIETWVRTKKSPEGKSWGEH